jgi:ABC-type transport system substrate-binding protein
MGVAGAAWLDRPEQAEAEAPQQQDLEALKKIHKCFICQNFLSVVSHAIYMRTDQAPFNDVRVRRAISHAIER